jgi:hypothetical protein
MPTVRNVIADIKSSLLHPALTSHFEVTIPIPDGLKDGKILAANGLSGFNSDRLQGRLQLMCSEATLPGSNLATFEINDNFHGVTERHAYRRVYDDRIDLTFYVDAENYIPIKYFETWMKYVVGESKAEGGGKLSSVKSNYFYRVNYPNLYMCKQGLKVIKFERTGNVSYDGSKMKGDKYVGPKLEYEFINSYPISIASMPVSYDSSSLLKCSVSFSYIRYIFQSKIEKDYPPEGPSSESPTRSPGDPSGPNPLAPFPPGQGFGDPKVEAAANRAQFGVASADPVVEGAYQRLLENQLHLALMILVEPLELLGQPHK